MRWTLLLLKLKKCFIVVWNRQKPKNQRKFIFSVTEKASSYHLTSAERCENTNDACGVPDPGIPFKWGTVQEFGERMSKGYYYTVCRETRGLLISLRIVFKHCTSFAYARPTSTHGTAYQLAYRCRNTRRTYWYGQNLSYRWKKINGSFISVNYQRATYPFLFWKLAAVILYFMWVESFLVLPPSNTQSTAGRRWGFIFTFWAVTPMLCKWIRIHRDSANEKGLHSFHLDALSCICACGEVIPDGHPKYPTCGHFKMPQPSRVIFQ